MVYVLTKCLLLFLYFFMVSSIGLMVLRLFKIRDRDAGETFILSAAIGFVVICEGLIILGLTGFFKPLPIVILFLSLFIVSAKEAKYLFQSLILSLKLPRNIAHITLLIVFSLFIFINILKCLLPPHGPTDVLLYHMTLPKLYLAYGSIISLPTLFPSYFPSNVEVLYSLSLIIGGPVFANLTHFGFALLTVIALYIYFKKYFGSELALLPGIIYLTAPVVNSWGTMAYVSNFLGFYLFILFILFWEWREETNNKIVLVIGLITGMVMGMKYQGVLYIGIIYLCCLFILIKKSRHFITLACFALGIGIILASPWYIRNFYNTGNPFFPILNDLFPSNMIRCCGDYTTNLLGKNLFLSEPQKAFKSFFHSMGFLYTFAFEDNDYNRFIGPVFLAFFPLIFLIKRNPIKWPFISMFFLMSVVSVFLLLGSMRYSSLLLIILSILISAGIREIYVDGKKGIKLYTIILFVAVTALYSLHNYHIMLRDNRYLTAFNPKLIPSFLRRFERSFAPAEFANRNLPPGSKLLFLGSFARFYYFNFEPLSDHEEQTKIIYEGAQTAEDILSVLQNHSITHIIRTEDINPNSGREAEFINDTRFINFTDKYLEKIYSGNKISIYSILYPFHFNNP